MMLRRGPATTRAAWGWISLAGYARGSASPSRISPRASALSLAGDQEDDGPRRVYDGDGERDAGGVQLQYGVRHDPAVVDLEGRGLGEEARGVAVGARCRAGSGRTVERHRSGRTSATPLRRPPPPPPAAARPASCGRSRRGRGRGAPRWPSGSSSPRGRGHGPLVPEEDVDLVPVDPVRVVAGQDLVGRLRGRAAGERDGETATLLDGLLGPGREVARGGLRRALRGSRRRGRSQVEDLHGRAQRRLRRPRRARGSAAPPRPGRRGRRSRGGRCARRGVPLRASRWC